MSSAICFNLDQSKILSAGNGLRVNAFYDNTGGENNDERWLTISEFMQL